MGELFHFNPYLIVWSQLYSNILQIFNNQYILPTTRIHAWLTLYISLNDSLNTSLKIASNSCSEDSTVSKS